MYLLKFLVQFLSSKCLVTTIYYTPAILSFNEHIITLNINVIEENIHQEFRLKNIDKTRNYFIEEINE